MPISWCHKTFLLYRLEPSPYERICLRSARRSVNRDQEIDTPMKSSKSNSEIPIATYFFEASTLRRISHTSSLIWTALRLHDALWWTSWIYLYRGQPQATLVQTRKKRTVPPFHHHPTWVLRVWHDSSGKEFLKDSPRQLRGSRQPKKKLSRLKWDYCSAASHVHSAAGLPQPGQTLSSTDSSRGVHPHESHIFASFSKSSQDWFAETVICIQQISKDKREISSWQLERVHQPFRFAYLHWRRFKSEKMRFSA